MPIIEINDGCIVNYVTIGDFQRVALDYELVEPPNELSEEELEKAIKIYNLIDHDSRIAETIRMAIKSFDNGNYGEPTGVTANVN